MLKRETNVIDLIDLKLFFYLYSDLYFSQLCISIFFDEYKIIRSDESWAWLPGEDAVFSI